MILNNIRDTYVSEASPSTKYSSGGTLAVRTGGTGDVFSYLKLSSGLGVPPGATITSAKVRVYNTELWSGSNTLTFREVTESWTSGLTWNTRPSTTVTDAVGVTKTGAAAGTEWLADVTSLVQSAFAAGAFYGFRVSVGGSTLRRLYSVNASSHKPTLEIEWTTAPSKPVQLNPALGRAVSTTTPTFQWDYLDSSSGAALTDYQLQLNYTDDDFTAPDVDTGEVASDAPEHTFTSALTADTPFFWRARNKNTSGVWSEWADSVESIVTAKDVLTITTPADTPDNVVAEFTPPKGWSFAGTQTAFQVIDTDSANTGIVYADSLRTPGTDNSYTSNVPQVFTAGVARTVVRVWDDVDRAETPGDPAYVEAVREFTLAYESSVGPVTGLVVTPGQLQPFATLAWSRATAPDSYTILRSDGAVFTNIDAADVLVSGTSYEWVDTTAAPRHELTWTVVAVVNGEGSDDSPTTDPVTLTPIYGWLLDPANPNWWLAIADQDAGTWGMGEDSLMVGVYGSDRLVLTSQALRGYEGAFSGGLYSNLPGVGSLSAQDLRDRAWYVKSNPVKVYRLVLSDMNIPVVLRNLVVAPTPHAELDYGISFELYQQGEVPWTV